MANEQQKFGNLLNIGMAATFAAVFLACVCFCFSHVIGVDDREHLQASYLIFRGMVPYRDFFEHHHPLMWYMFAPLFYLFGESVRIYWVMRGFMLCASLITGYFIYQSGRLLGVEKRTAWFGVILWLCFPVVQMSGSDFRPDNWMIATFVAGFAYFLRYLKEKRLVCLQLSFMLFFISLLFLQKAVLLFVPFAVVCLWLLAVRKIRLGDFSKALLLPVGFSALIIGWVYLCGGLRRYWELNWLLNLSINIASSVGDVALCVLALGGVAAIGGIWQKHNLLYRVVCIFYLLLATWLLFRRPWHVHYLLIYYPFLALIMAYWMDNLPQRVIGVMLIIAAGYLVYGNIKLIKTVRDDSMNINVIQKASQLVLEHSGTNDLVLGDVEGYIGDMRLSALGYYWFSIGHMAENDAYLFGRHAQPDFDRIIKSYKPKVIANGWWRNCALGLQYLQNLDCRFWAQIDREYLNKHYDNIGFIYVRKD